MLRIFFYLLIAYLPFQIALNPYPGVDLMSGRILILALFFYWLWILRMASVRSGEKSLNGRKFLNFQSIFLLIFLFFVLLSLTRAEELFWGIRKTFVFFSIFPLAFLTIEILNNFEKTSPVRDSDNRESLKEKQISNGVKKTIKILVFSALPIALIGIFQFFAQFTFIPGLVTNFWEKWLAPVFYGRAFGSLVTADSSWLIELGGNFYFRAISLFPDPHTFAFYLGLIMPLAVALLFLAKENRKLLFAICFLLFVALLLTFSRGAYFAMLITLIFFAFLFIIKHRAFRVPKKYKLLLAACCLLFAACFLIPFSPVSQCFYSAFDFSRHSNVERINVWKDALNSIGSHPWLGVGIGNFPKVQDPWAKYHSPINAHSVYLDIAAETGIFALWSWLVLFIGTIFGLLRNTLIYTDKKTDLHRWRVISWGLAGSLVWFSSHAAVETPIYNSTILAILMVILGLSATIIQKSKIKNQNDI